MSATSLHAAQQLRLLLIACATLTAFAAVMLVARPIQAESGVPIPAPAGTTWSIIAGYNTGTHGDHDGGDPHAIDIVRTDAATDWTAVLAPIDGAVSWRGDNCLTIADAAGYAHLLCHLAPAAHIQRGRRVTVGEQVGQVFPAGYDANGGVAHIHYAVHATHGGGLLARSIPFSGDYAIEGHELHWRDEYNLHSGLEFVSTNRAGWQAPDATVDVDINVNVDAGADDSEPSDSASDALPSAAQPASSPAVPADAPVGGWRTIAVERNTSVAGLYSLLDAPLRRIVVHDPNRDAYDTFDPTNTSTSHVAIRSIRRGQAVWAEVEPDAAWLPPAPTAPEQVTVGLRRGANLVAWLGPDRNVASALRNVVHVSHAYRYDPIADEWRFWSPDGPDALNTLETLRSGDAFYVHVRAGSTWTQLR